MAESNVTLRAYTGDDLDLFSGWIRKDYVKRWLGDPEEWIFELKNETGEFSYFNHFIVEVDDTPIGYCQYYDCSLTPKGFEWDDEPPGTFAIGYLIGEEAYLGKGLGHRIVQALCERVVSCESVRRIVADPMQENETSISLLEKHGFSLDDNTGLYMIDLEADSSVEW